jgi:NHLM bacteriocin system ABC transporter ATP-binding protein
MVEAQAATLAHAGVLSLDATVGYRVEQGSVTIFSVEHRDDEPRGARDPLLDVAAGGVVAAIGAHPSRKLIAVPIGPAVVRALESIDDAARAGWHHQLATAAGIVPPASDEPMAAFASRVFDALGARSEAQRRRREARAAQQRQASGDALVTAVRSLGTLLSRDKSLAIPEGEALSEAMYAVGSAADIEMSMKPIEATEDSDRVERVAAASRVRVRPVILRGRWWREDCGPLLGFQRVEAASSRSAGDDSDDSGERRPVALLPSKPGAYDLYDPIDNTHRPVDDAEADRFDPQASVLYRPLPDGKLDTIDLLRFAFARTRRDTGWIIACSLAATALTMVTPIAMNALVGSALPNGNESMVWELGAALLAAGLGQALYSLTAGLLAVRVETRADADVQAGIWDRLLRLEMAFFRRFTVGDLAQRVSAVSEIRSSLSGVTFRTLLGGIFATLNLGLLVYYIPSLATIALLTALATSLLTLVSGLAVMRLERKLMELRGRISGTMFQLIQGITKLRIAAAEERAFLHWARPYAEQQRLSLEVERIGDVMRVVNLWVSTLGVVLLFWYTTKLMGGPSPLSTGVFLAFYSAYGAFQSGLSDVSNLSATLLHVKVLRERAQPILEATPEIDDHKASPGKLRGALRLDRVSFRYREGGPLTLDDVSLHAEPGERIALVGPSGSGKSTILRLLLGFETPSSGVVRIDGQDTGGLNMPEVRRQLGVVLQHARISAGSLYENVASGRLMPLSQAEHALHLAGMADDLASMPMGMHTVVSEGGTNLSGGQKQRLFIARALATKPALLLFDEATSALDNRTQAIVTASLNGLDVTQVIVAHRLSTIRSANRIYVLSAGRIVEQGTFDELVAHDGFFAQLMRRQAQ